MGPTHHLVTTLNIIENYVYYVHASSLGNHEASWQPYYKFTVYSTYIHWHLSTTKSNSISDYLLAQD